MKQRGIVIDAPLLVYTESTARIRRESRLAPPVSAAATHLGCLPRPVQVCDASAGLRYFGGTLPPADLLPEPLVARAAFRGADA